MSAPDGPAIVAAAIAVAVAIPVTRPSIVVPGSRTDEEAADEPGRAVVAIGRASVGIVPVVTVRADWGSVIRSVIGRAVIAWIDPDSDADRNLCMGVNCRGN
jgi:hypothetical protein